ncbi:MAG: hypothetical protein M0P91_01590 [Sulfuricurvum sp.]|uniref:hypothetical protein n=1 Tax=Sulfuricurvum sp. TaxID=2025608 RepID=UPI0025FF25A0|nr:hypothetical protein [Sulfuricurvum sp.]MCK9371863.1 hypothetical protein [Sulfuricurvum sp.]
MKKSLLFAITMTLLAAGCAQKQLVINGLICPQGHTEELIKSDFRECRYYDLKAATNASMPPLTIECKTCLEKKGYKVEQ